MRNINFANDEYYHVYNRGTDKRSIFIEEEDVKRFLKSMCEFNVIDPIGSLYENSFLQRQLGSSASKLPDRMTDEERLVDIVCFCLITGSIVYNTAQDLYIGFNSPSGGGFYTNGTIDDVRIYSRALSASEIKSLYTAGR